jgi:hypothetical protein
VAAESDMGAAAAAERIPVVLSRSRRVTRRF